MALGLVDGTAHVPDLTSGGFLDAALWYFGHNQSDPRYVHIRNMAQASGIGNF